MNEQNLIPNSKRTREELQEMGRKGGIKSGEVRRRNKERKRVFEEYANEIVKNFPFSPFDKAFAETFSFLLKGKKEK